MITTVGAPVQEALYDIGMKSIKMVIYMECDGKSSWVRSLVEVWPNQSVDQWVDLITNPPSGEEVPNIELIIDILPGTNKKTGGYTLA